MTEITENVSKQADNDAQGLAKLAHCGISDFGNIISTENIVKVIKEKGIQCIEEFHRAGVDLNILTKSEIYPILVSALMKEQNEVFEILQRAGVQLNKLNGMKVHVSLESSGIHKQVAIKLKEFGYIDYFNICYLSEADIRKMISLGEGVHKASFDPCITVPLFGVSSEELESANYSS